MTQIPDPANEIDALAAGDTYPAMIAFHAKDAR